MAKRLADIKKTPIVFDNGGLRNDQLSFDDKSSWNLLTNSAAKALHDCILAAYNEQRPMIIYDFNEDQCLYLKSAGVSGYLGTLGSQMAFGNFVVISTNAISFYDFDTRADENNNPVMDLDITNEQYLASDNIKTLFGNKSIYGAGNIDLYRHNLVINGTIRKEYISSNNLVADSIQDLTTLTKAVNGTTIIIDKDTTMVYSGGVWKVNGTNVTSVADTVYTI